MQQFGTTLGFILFIWAMQIPAMGQNADDYFHDGANAYIGGQWQQALATVTEGLKKYPTDPRLKALLEKIQRQQKKQQQSQSSQQNSQQNHQQQNQQQQQQQHQNAEKKQRQSQETDEQKQRPQDQQKRHTEAQQRQHLTREEAERLLKALQGKIDETQKRPYRIAGKKKKVEKDW